MKYAVVFDVHLWNHRRMSGALIRGINHRGLLTLQTLHQAVDGANAEEAPLIVAGDLIDEAGPIWPQFAAAIREELLRVNQGVYLILGNHDMTAANDHSLELYKHSSIQVIDEVTHIDGINLIPFHCDITESRLAAPVVIGHFGVFDDAFPAFMKKSHDAWHVARLFAFLREREIRCCLLGDWHQRYLWALSDSVPTTALPSGTQHRSTGRPKADQGGWQRILDPIYQRADIRYFREDSLIMQGGSLIPTGFDNKGLRGYGTLAIVDTDEQSLCWRELPGPRFCTVHSSEEEALLITEAQQLGHQLFLRRYYTDAKPEKPVGVEAYEALPIALQQKAKLLLGIDTISTASRFEALVSEWLDSIRASHGDKVDLYEQLLKKYL